MKSEVKDEHMDLQDVFRGGGSVADEPSGTSAGSSQQAAGRQMGPSTEIRKRPDLQEVLHTMPGIMRQP